MKSRDFDARVFPTDHKVFGLQYAFTGPAFLVLGFAFGSVSRRTSDGGGPCSYSAPADTARAVRY